MEEHYTLGTIKWYDQEKGFGVISSSFSENEYFVHYSNLDKNIYKSLLTEGVPLLFIPHYDEKRERLAAQKIKLIDNFDSITKSFNLWTNQNNDKISIITSLVSWFLNHTQDSEKNISNNFVTLLTKYSGDVEHLYRLLSVLKEAYNKKYKYLYGFNKIENGLVEKLPSSVIHEINKNLELSDEAKIDYAFTHQEKQDEVIETMLCDVREKEILDALISFAICKNESKISDISKDKSYITKADSLDLVGKEFISKVITIIKEQADDEVLINLYKDGYFTSIDFDKVMNNLDSFNVREIRDILIYQDGSIQQKKNILLAKANTIESSEYNALYTLKEIFNCGNELLSQNEWQTVFINYIATKGETVYNPFMTWLYKEDKYEALDENFIVYYIKDFENADIKRIVTSDKVTNPQREKILKASFFRWLTEEASYHKVQELNESITIAKDCLNDFIQWFDIIQSTFTPEQRIYVWEHKMSDRYPKEIIEEKLKKGGEKAYTYLEELYSHNVLTKEDARETLNDILASFQEVVNRSSFYNILYSIKTLNSIAPKAIQEIASKNNDYYNVILWHLFLSEDFKFDVLGKLFIYFSPEDQVVVTKHLFMLAEKKKLKLTVHMLDSLTRVDADMFKLIAKEQPTIPIDLSSEIVIKALQSLACKGKFTTDAEVSAVIYNNSKYCKTYNFHIGKYFDICQGRMGIKSEWIQPLGKVTKNGNYFNIAIYPTLMETAYSKNHGYYERGYRNGAFQEMVATVKQIPGRRWNSNDSVWEVPEAEKDAVYHFALKYRVEISGEQNYHLKKVKEDKGSVPRGIRYCEGRIAPTKDRYSGKDFYWCRNSKCFRNCVAEHNSTQWKDYTLLDFCKILGLNTDYDGKDGIWVNGKYLIFSSIINRANSILEHLKCRVCGEMLEPATVSNYLAHVVTSFKCTNKNCSRFDHSIYISKCFNWKCNGIIDGRDSKCCPNGWFICPECGSCCSNRIFQQRINHRRELGLPRSLYLERMINEQRGHLEKPKYFCSKCGEEMQLAGDNLYKCPLCGIEYDRKKYDFMDYRTMRTIKSGPES